MKIAVSKLDKLFSEYVRLLSGGYCKRCKKYFGESRLQTAHFHSRRKHAIRWDKDNVACLCGGCHMYIDGNPFVKIEFFLELLGQERFTKLNERAEKLYPKPDKEELTAYFKEKIREV